MLEEKSWYYSKTIWGGVIAAAASLSSILGVSLDPAIQGELSTAIVQLVGAIGAITAIYGRLAATEVISPS